MPAYPKSQQLAKGPSRRQSRSQARKVYDAVTEAARNEQGQLICAICGLPGLDSEMVRDHVTLRSQGGKTAEANVRIVHMLCHVQRHLGGQL